MPVLDKTNKVQIAKYNEYVRTKDFALTQDYYFLSADKNNKFEIVYLEQNGNITAAMALLIIDIDRNTTVLYSHRGPCQDIYDVKIINELVKEAETIAKQYNAVALFFDPEVAYDDKLIEIYKKNGYKIKNNMPRFLKDINVLNDSFHIILKDKKLEDIEQEFLNKTKYNIETAIKRKIKIKKTTLKRDFEAFANLYKNENIVKFTDIKNLETFKNLLKDLDNDFCKVFTASLDGKILSAAVICKYGNKVKCIEEATKSDALGIFARSLIHYEAIKWAIDCGFEIYDMGEIEEKDELDLRFKEGFATKQGHIKYLGKIYKLFNMPKLLKCFLKSFGR